MEPPRDPPHGDLATNAAMVLAKPTGMKPRVIAVLLAGALAGLAGVAGWTYDVRPRCTSRRDRDVHEHLAARCLGHWHVGRRAHARQSW